MPTPLGRHSNPSAPETALLPLGLTRKIPVLPKISSAAAAQSEEMTAIPTSLLAHGNGGAVTRGGGNGGTGAGSGTMIMALLSSMGSTTFSVPFWTCRAGAACVGVD